jgi:4a-hydroxytetrahydrobiopterin dehydratase
LSEAEIEQRLAGAAGWRRGEGSSPSRDASPCGDDASSQMDAIVRDLELADFAAAIAVLNRVAEVAEAANHHPDILLHGWNKLRLTLSTHSQGGLTEADFALAGRINAVL